MIALCKMLCGVTEREIAYYQERVNLGRTKIFLEDADLSKPNDCAVYFERNQTGTVYTLVKEFNSLLKSWYGRPYEQFAWVTLEDSYAPKEHQGKYRLEIVSYHGENGWYRAESKYARFHAHYDSIGEAMANAVLQNNPHWGLPL